MRTSVYWKRNLEQSWEQSCSDRRRFAPEGERDRGCPATADNPSRGRACGTDDLRLGWRCDTLPQRQRTRILCGIGPIGESDRRKSNSRQDYAHGFTPASTHTGTIWPRATVAMSVRTLSTAQSDCGASAHSACTAKDRSSCRSTTYTTHRVLRTARWHELRSDTPASRPDQRRFKRSIGGNPRSGIAKAAVEHGLASEAIAGEVEGDQVVQCLGSRLRTAQARSLVLDWPVLLPVRQHVPGHRALEHEWKDGDPWRSVADTSLEQRPSLSNNIDVVPDHHVNGAVHSSPLTAIMEGIAKTIVQPTYASITRSSSPSRTQPLPGCQIGAALQSLCR